VVKRLRGFSLRGGRYLPKLPRRGLHGSNPCRAKQKRLCGFRLSLYRPAACLINRSRVWSRKTDEKTESSCHRGSRGNMRPRPTDRYQSQYGSRKRIDDWRRASDTVASATIRLSDTGIWHSATFAIAVIIGLKDRR